MLIKPSSLRVGSHPVAHGLVWAAAPGRDIPYEAISSGLASLGSAASLDGATPHGFSHATTDATNGGVFYPFSELLRTITDKCTIVVWCNLSVLGGWSTLLSIPYTNSGWADPYNMLVLKQESSGSNLLFGFSDTGNVGRTVSSDSGGIQYTDGWTMYAVTRNGTSVRFYRNGKPHGTDKTISANSVGWQSRTIGLANRSSYSPGEGLQGKIPLAMIYNRALSDSDIALLFAFPYIWTTEGDLKTSLFVAATSTPTGAGIGACTSGSGSASSTKGGQGTASGQGTNASQGASAKAAFAVASTQNRNASQATAAKGAFGAASGQNANSESSSSAKGGRGAGSGQASLSDQAVSAKGGTGAASNQSTMSDLAASQKGAFAAALGTSANSDQAASAKKAFGAGSGQSRNAAQAVGAKGAFSAGSSQSKHSGWAMSTAGAPSAGFAFGYAANSGFASSTHGGRGSALGQGPASAHGLSAKGAFGAGRGDSKNSAVSVSAKAAFAAGRAVGSGSGFASSTNTSGAVPNINGAGRGFGSGSGTASSRKGGRGAGSIQFKLVGFASSSTVRLPFYSNIAPQASIKMADVWWRKDYITEDSARHLFELFKEKTH